MLENVQQNASNVYKFVQRIHWVKIAVTLAILIACYVFLFTSTSIFLFSVIMRYSPNVYFGYPLHFNYSQAQPSTEIPLYDKQQWFGPEVITKFALLNNTEKRDEGVTVSQILIHLDMPESEVNKQVGMFMVTMQLKSANGETLFTSSRPCMLRYKSTLTNFFWIIARLPLLVLGLTEEKQTLDIEMVVHNDTSLIEYLNEKIPQAASLVVSINDQRLQIYNAQIHFLANITGWRRFFYEYKWTSSVLLILFLAGVEMCFVSLAFACCCTCCTFRSRPKEVEEEHEEGEEEEGEEEEGESSEMQSSETGNRHSDESSEEEKGGKEIERNKEESSTPKQDEQDSSSDDNSPKAEEAKEGTSQITETKDVQASAPSQTDDSPQEILLSSSHQTAMELASDSLRKRTKKKEKKIE